MIKTMKNSKIFYITTSVLLASNILTSIVLYKIESKTNYIERYLERRRGVVDRELSPDFWCIQGWNNTLSKLDYDCDICFFGHSQIASSDFREYFPNKNIVNLGYPGDKLKGMMLRVEQIAYVKPEKVFIMAGVNSLGYSKDEFEDAYNELITAIKTQVPSAELFLFNILPQSDGELGKAINNENIQVRNTYIRNYAEENKITMIDLYSIYCDKDGNLIDSLTVDGLHLTKDAYSRWAECLIPYVD